MTEADPKTVRLTVELTEEQAWQLAQFLKRAGHSHYRALSATDDEAYCMLEAGDILRNALADAGYAPR